MPKTGSECWETNPPTYFNLLAAPVTTLAKISTALLDGWPNVQTRCDTDASTTPHTYKLGRGDRQSYGSRFMLGIVSLGDAARYGLRSAALETTKGTYVAPTNASLSAALKLSKQKAKLGPFVLDQADVRKSRTAYPGTMVVYTAARLQNLDQDDAAKVAQFVRVSTSEGQRQGSGNGAAGRGLPADPQDRGHRPLATPPHRTSRPPSRHRRRSAATPTRGTDHGLRRWCARPAVARSRPARHCPHGRGAVGGPDPVGDPVVRPEGRHRCRPPRPSAPTSPGGCCRC